MSAKQTSAWLWVILCAAACDDKSEPASADPKSTPPAIASDPADPPPVAAIERDMPSVDKLPGIEFAGKPVEQAADFPVKQWVRTVLFDGKTPYIGFTYVDKSKGNSIKGEAIGGLSPAEIKAKLRAEFPSSTMQPIPKGHPMTPLSPEQIAAYDLPKEPDWVSFY